MLSPEEQEDIGAAINGINISKGAFKCKKCNQGFDSPVEVRHHKKYCRGPYQRGNYKTSRRSARPVEYPENTASGRYL